MRRAFDQPRSDARERAADVDVGRPVHPRSAVEAVGQRHLPDRVDGAARGLATGLDPRPVRLIALDEGHLDVERRRDEAHADLRACIEVVSVHDLDRLHAGAAAADLLRVHEEAPDLRPRGGDLFSAVELHAVLPDVGPAH